MKITTNMIGNYSPQIINNPVKHTGKNEVPQKTVSKQAAHTTNKMLSKDEKNFFMDLYPQSKPEINDYHFYQKSGKMSGVKIGSLFDKRG